MAYTAEVHAAYELRRYHERRAEALALLGGACVRCGSLVNLEFDHIDPAGKLFAIGALWSVAYERFLVEIQKCQLLCREHHIEKTALENQVRKGGVKHNRWRYTKHKCRCVDCVSDYKIYRQQRYASTGV